MNIDTLIKKKDRFYRLTHKQYAHCDKSDLETIPSLARNNSVSILVDHETIPTPCIAIKLNLYTIDNFSPIGNYTLYLNYEDETIIDEFLAIN